MPRRCDAWTRERLPRALPRPRSHALIVLVALDFDRLRDFVDFRALIPIAPTKAGSEPPGHLSPLEALGIWPTSEFRLSAGERSGPAIAFYAGAVVVRGAGRGSAGWVRRHGTAIPAALAAVLMYLGARAFGTVYSEAKALAIVAPLVALIALGGIGETDSPRLWPSSSRWASLCRLLILHRRRWRLKCTWTSWPRSARWSRARRCSFLGRDNFVLWELRGQPFTHVSQLLRPVLRGAQLRARERGLEVRLRRGDRRDPRTVPIRDHHARRLRKRASARLRDRRRDAFVRSLGEARPGGRRRAAEDGPSRAEVLDASASRRNGCRLPRRPLLFPAADWSNPTTRVGLDVGNRARRPAGRLGRVDSLRLDATGEPQGGTGAYETTLPGNLDYRGTGPFWDAGQLASDGMRNLTIEARSRTRRPPESCSARTPSPISATWP